MANRLVDTDSDSQPETNLCPSLESEQDGTVNPEALTPGVKDICDRFNEMKSSEQETGEPSKGPLKPPTMKQDRPNPDNNKKDKPYHQTAYDWDSRYNGEDWRSYKIRPTSGDRQNRGNATHHMQTEQQEMDTSGFGGDSLQIRWCPSAVVPFA